MPHYIPPSKWTHDFFLLRKKSASLTPDQGLIGLYLKNGRKLLIIEKNSNYECIREALEKAFPNLKFIGRCGTTTFTCYSWSRGVHRSTSERIVKVICDICEDPSGGYSS